MEMVELLGIEEEALTIMGPMLLSPLVTKNTFEVHLFNWHE